MKRAPWRDRKRTFDTLVVLKSEEKHYATPTTDLVTARSEVSDGVQVACGRQQRTASNEPGGRRRWELCPPGTIAKTTGFFDDFGSSEISKSTSMWMYPPSGWICWTVEAPWDRNGFEGVENSARVSRDVTSTSLTRWASISGELQLGPPELRKWCISMRFTKTRVTTKAERLGEKRTHTSSD